MAEFGVGDIVVLTSGSMRMGVETVEDGIVRTVWCHEGVIGRDAFPAALLKKWEHRDDDSRPSKPGPRPHNDRAKPYRGDREGGGKPYPDRPKGKPGWDGKPREKKFFRKD
ncbi:MAG: hypothetical protein AAGA32_07690 [Pseudomonadota bacterium]